MTGPVTPEPADRTDRDELAAEIADVILTEAPNYEAAYGEYAGIVVGVADAATVVARWVRARDSAAADVVDPLRGGAPVGQPTSGQEIPADVYDTLTTAYQHIDEGAVAEGVAEVQARYRRGPVGVRTTPEPRLREILKGVDCTQSDPAAEGWWETSTGAEFGAGKLAEVEAYVERLRAELDAANGKLATIAEMHRREELANGKAVCDICAECGTWDLWPCRTAAVAAALDGSSNA